MPTISELRGLKASDRSESDKKAINQVMGYQDTPTTAKVPTIKPSPVPESAPISSSGAFWMNQIKYQRQLDNLYQETLKENNAKYGVNRNSVNSTANEYIDNIARQVSSHFKRYAGTDKIPENSYDPKALAAGYDAQKKIYGEDSANIWLDNQFKNIVGENQSWWEQAMDGLSHLVPAIEGGAIQLTGNIYGTLNPLISLFDQDLDLPDNDDLGWWGNYFNNIIDNPITRYGRDLEHAGASHIAQGFANLLGINDETVEERLEATKNSATKYNPEGIGADAIITTEDQDNSWFNSATPWQALQSGGFTALSMMTGWGLAKGSSMLFGSLAKGANWLNKTNRLLKTTKALEKTLEGLKKAQNFTDIAVVPGLVGGTEGMMEGLNTKIQVEQEATQNLNDFYRDKIEKEAKAIYDSQDNDAMIEVRTDHGKELVKAGKTYAQIYKEVWDKYKDAYIDSRRQIEYASSTAGRQNFWANSLINGMVNTTLKAGLQAPRVQETLRNSKLTGWAYRDPKFQINADGTVSPKTSKLGTITQILKEPAGEGAEEYLQSLSNDTFAAGAENNINEFIKARFNGDGAVKVGDSFSSDWSAAWTALGGSVTDKESIQSAILGAVSSAMGTVSTVGRGYHRDDKGNVVQNGIFSPKNFTRSLKADGTQESYFEMASRITPWRSGAINAYMDAKKENAEAKETAATLTEWLKDPQNREKWDGLTGTASWLTQMQNAAESNDQFSFRKAQMGKAINDITMLSKLKGTPMYDAIIADLQRSSQMDVMSEEAKSMIDKMRASDKEGLQDKTDDEILEKISSNANKMLGLMSSVEKEGKTLDRMMGRVDEDTKNSLIFGKIMQEDFKERKDGLEQQVDAIKGKIKSSRSSSNVNLDEEAKALIMEYGSLRQALKEEEKLSEKQKKTEEKIAELKAIDKSMLSEKQKEELRQKELEQKKLSKEKEKFQGLYAKDEKGNRTKEVNRDLLFMTLNEEEIMNLDPATRAKVLAQGAAKFYNATHQNRQKVDALNMQINEIQQKIDALEEQKKTWMSSDGKVKKGHNKQVIRNDKAISQLEKDKFSKMRELDVERGTMDSKQIYSDEQQAVIDNLLQQATAIDEDFLDKTVDLFRLDKGIRDYHTQYQAILSDPNAFYNYVQKAKYKAALDLTKRRAEWVAGIKDYKEYSKELNKLMANASQGDMNVILNTMRERSNKEKQEAAKIREQQQVDDIIQGKEDGTLYIREDGEVLVQGQQPMESTETNFDKFIDNQKQHESLLAQFSKNTHLTDNDMSLLMDAMQYLSQEGINVTDRDKAVEALLEKDEEGNLGGKFRQWVEERNSSVSSQQEAFMPVFTSIGQVVNQYVELLNGEEADRINKSNCSPTVAPVTLSKASTSPTENPAPATKANTEAPKEDTDPSSATPKLFDIAGSTPESGHIIDDEGTVATDATIAMDNQRQAMKALGEEEMSELEKLFLNVTTPEIAKSLNIFDNLLETMVFTEDGKNESITEEEKTVARQYLESIAVNSEEVYDTMEELIDAIQEQVVSLQKQQDMMEDESNKVYGHASNVLRSLATRLRIKAKRRTASPISRRANTQSSIMHTANIAWIQSKNPGAWAVQFTEKHAIDEWVRDNPISLDTPVYFISDSEWTAEVTRQMEDAKKNDPNKKGYDTLTNMPLVAAIEVAAPKNPDTTTAIQVGNKWYQPIGVMPSKDSKVSGAGRTYDIRKLASKEEGTHLVTVDGMPNGKPLVTKVAGKNYIKAHHPDSVDQNKRVNVPSNNSDLISTILYTLPLESIQRLQGMSKKDMLADDEYIKARAAFLSRLSWGTDYTGSQEVLNSKLLYTPDDLKHNEGRANDESASPMLVFTKPMAETQARESDKSLIDVVRENDRDALINFNSRTQRLFSEVIRPLFENIPFVDKHGDKSARVITQADLEADPNAYEKEAERLTQLFRGYDGTKATAGIKGISSYIYVNKEIPWHFEVTALSDNQDAKDITSSKSVYKVLLVNEDSAISPVIELGTITATAKTGQPNQDNIKAAKDMFWNFMRECVDGVLKDNAFWQTPKNDILSLNHADIGKSDKARKNIGSMIDDGLYELGGSSLVYDVDGIELKAPLSTEGKILYPIDTVANSSNATSPTPMDSTPLAQGTITLSDGTVVDSTSGAILKGPGRPKTGGDEKSEAEKKAEAITAKIVEDSKQFTLSEDEKYYYILDKNTGERVKYVRVTSVISADRRVVQWVPSIKEIKEKFGIEELPGGVLSSLEIVAKLEKGGSPQMLGLSLKRLAESISDTLNLPIEDVKKTFAELRTEHAKTKYAAWGTPSTAIGNTADVITRDFLAGKLKDHYPNITDEVLRAFTDQLKAFKTDLDAKGIHIVSEGVMAHGTVTITDNDGNSHSVKVAGTLDLFGYDSQGNFYIFDMKTVRDHSREKLDKESGKWSRQISMYADLLQQSYPGVHISPRNLRIIPINVGYPAPKGKGPGMSPMGKVYSIVEKGQPNEGQLQNTLKDGTVEDVIIDDTDNFRLKSTEMNGQFQPGYTHFDINWDNLTSIDQEIASSLEEQAASTTSTPKTGEVELPVQSGGLDDTLDTGYTPSGQTQTQPATPSAPPVNQTGLPSWENLEDAKKEVLAKAGWATTEEEYNDLLNDPSCVEAMKNELKCAGL